MPGMKRYNSFLRYYQVTLFLSPKSFYDQIPLLAILLFIGASASAQTQTEKEIKDQLTHKWKVTHMEQGGQKMPLPAEFGNSFLDLKADGTVLMIDSEKTERGKWTYDHKTKTVTTVTEEETQKFEVVKISETELVIKTTMEEMTLGMYLKRVN